jgi:hypothetical protein
MWLYEDEEFKFEDHPDTYGFIYKIENITNDRLYIGRKFCTRAGYKTVKGKRKKIRLESDWKDYYGSSKTLLEEVAAFGEEAFVRTIIRLCKSRSECNYWEAWHIFNEHAVLDNRYYNSWISCKITSVHVKSQTFNSLENLCVD